MLDITTEAGGRAERRLREEQIIWMTTVRSDDQPQSVPVWFFLGGRGVPRLLPAESAEAAQHLKGPSRRPRP